MTSANFKKTKMVAKKARVVASASENIRLATNHVENDSDEELQDALENEEIVPGLNQLLPFIKRNFVNDKIGMAKSLASFKVDLDWVQRMDLVCDLAPLAPELALDLNESQEKANHKNAKKSATQEEILANNDFKREIAFYRQAQTAVMEAIPRLHKLGIPTQRPEDYFAQMSKSDAHMDKVRKSLITKQTIMERKEKAKKLRDLKKYGKQVQREATIKKQHEKKAAIDAVKKLRTKRGRREDELLGDIEPHNDEFPTAKNKKKPNSNKQQQKQQKKKAFREYKDKKFGYGGKKKGSKRNTAESSADVFGKSKKRFDTTKGKKQKGGRPMGGRKQRPGKMNRKNRKTK